MCFRLGQWRIAGGETQTEHEEIVGSNGENYDKKCARCYKL